VAVLIGVAAGLLGALLAVFLQRLAVGVAGLLAGGYLLTVLLERSSVQLGVAAWLPYIIGGIIGAVLMMVLFDWGLIFLSSLAGANLIGESLRAGPSLEWILFAGLVIAGVVIQAGIMYNERRRTTSPSV